MRYVGAISDADIMINLAKVNRLDILELLFKEIIIPIYVYESEIKRHAGKHLTTINQAIIKSTTIFKIVDRKEDIAINGIAKGIIEDKKKIIGPGESECAGYALAFGFPIIISDNYTEHKWLSEFITLTHRDILALCVYYKDLTTAEAEAIFNGVNCLLSHPTKNSYVEHNRKSMKTFEQRGWSIYLGIREP